MLWFSRERERSPRLTFPEQAKATCKSPLACRETGRCTDRRRKGPLQCKESSRLQRCTRRLLISSSIPDRAKRKLKALNTIILLRALQNYSRPSGRWGVRGRVAFYVEISAASSHPPSAHVRLKQANLWPSRRSQDRFHRLQWRRDCK